MQLTFAGALTIAFVVLRLLDVTHWSWWWVLSPLWIGAGLALLFVAGFFGLVKLVTKRF